MDWRAAGCDFYGLAQVSVEWSGAVQVGVARCGAGWDGALPVLGKMYIYT